MIRPKTNAFFVRLRRLVLAALVLGSLGLIGLLVFGRAGKDEESASQEPEASKASRKLTLVGEDFDYTFSEGERPLFHIRGRSIAVDKHDTVFLEGVGLTIYDQEGREYHVSSRKANFNRSSNEGQLQGEVLLKGPGDLELRSDRIDIKDNSNLIISREPVKIFYAKKFVVAAGRMQVSLDDEHFVLAQGAKAHSLPGSVPEVSLEAQRLVYERKARWLHVEGGADLRRGIDQLHARRLSVQLAEDEETIQFVRALWDVQGVTHSTVTPNQKSKPQATIVRYSGSSLAATLRPESNELRRVELEGDETRRAELIATGDGLVRTLTAKRIEGVLAEGVLGGADAFGGVEIREIPKHGASGLQPVQRQANGQRGQATFTPDGQLATLVLDSNVIFRDGSMNASGARAALDLEKGRGEFFGTPVTVVNERGTIQAPRIVYNTDQKIINARGGVKASLEKVSDTSLGESPLASGEGPVHVESQEAFWRNTPTSFLFRGDVRAWQGENLLLAPELRGDRDQDQLNATGGVKTLLVQRVDEPKGGGRAGNPASGTPAASATRRAPIQVVGRDLEYRKKQRLIIYTGNVRVDQSGKTLTCQKLEVELDEGDHQAKSMTCTGEVKVNDPKVGRLIEGQRAVYQIVQRRIDIFGEPVVMSDREGNRVRGRAVAYFIDDGRVEVKGKESAP